MVKHAVDVQEVDDFLARPKSLSGDPPQWKIAARQVQLSAQWIMLNDLGIAVGKLRFNRARDQTTFDGAVVIFRECPIWRVDLEPAWRCEHNPPGASALGLEPIVCGPHEHEWPDNRNHVASTGVCELPYRRKLQPKIRRFHQLLPYLCDRINLRLEPQQRSFDHPPQGELLTAPVEGK